MKKLRNHKNELAQDEVLPCFVDDDPNGGGCIVQCGGCGCEQLLSEIQCKECGKHFVLRPWWTW